MLGTAMLPVALAFAVLERRGDPGDLALVLAASTVPTIILLVVGGSLADRVDRSLVLKASSGLSAAGLAFMALAVMYHLPLQFLVIAALLNGMVQAFMRPALIGIVPELVEKNQLKRANALLSTARNSINVIGPSVGGILVAGVGGGWALLFGAGAYALAAMLLFPVRLERQALHPADGIWQDLLVGWKYFSKTRWLWLGAVGFGVTNAILMGVWGVLGPYIADRSFGAGPWGVILSAKAAGLLLVSATMTVRARAGHLETASVYGRTMLWLSITGVPVLLLGVTSNVLVLIAFSFLAGIGAGYSGIMWDSLRQSSIPRHMLSRASSYDDLASFAAIPVGQVGVIPLTAAFTAATVATVGGAVFVAAPIVCLALVARTRAWPPPHPDRARAQ